MLLAEGDADDGDAADEAKHSMHGGNLPPTREDPDDVEHGVETSATVLLLYHLVPEGPQRKGTELHQLHTEGNADNGDAEQQPDKPIQEGHDKSTQNDPKDVSEKFHCQVSFSFSSHKVTLFFVIVQTFRAFFARQSLLPTPLFALFYIYNRSCTDIHIGIVLAGVNNSILCTGGAEGDFGAVDIVVFKGS